MFRLKSIFNEKHLASFPVVFIVFLSSAFGQISSFSFDHLTIDQGLSNSVARCFYQDSKGFMWIGTMDGLNRYDGYSFKVFNHNPRDASTISENFIADIIEDKSGRLWIGTKNGLNLYDASSDEFTRYHSDTTTGNSITSDVINCIRPDMFGNIWLGTNNGITIIKQDAAGKEKGSYRFIKIFKEKKYLDTLAAYPVYDLLFDHNDDCWMATPYGLIKLLLQPQDTAYNNVKYIHFFPDEKNKNSLGTYYVTRLAEDNQNYLWCASLDNLFEKIKISKKPEDQKSLPFIKINPWINFEFQAEFTSILSLLNTKDGKIIAGTNLKGLIAVNNVVASASHDFTLFNNSPTDPHSLLSNQVFSLFEDKSGLVWIGTDLGISIYNPLRKNFNSRNLYQVFGNMRTTVNAIVYDETGGLLWIGTDDNGIKILRDRDKRIFEIKNDPSNPKSISENSIQSLLLDSKGNIWAGTTLSGLNLIEKNEIEKIKSESEFKNLKINCRNFNVSTDPADKTSLGGSLVLSLAEDSSGNVWAGTQNGFYRHNSAKNNFSCFFIHPEKANRLFGSHFIKCMLALDDGKMWLGTENGLFLFSPEKGIEKKFYFDEKEKGSISNNIIACIFIDSKKRTWIGTNGGGLNLLDDKTKKFRAFGISEGMPNNVINSIQEDKHGSLWISTNFGLAMMNTNDFSIIKYNTNDGLTNNAFTIGSSWKSKKGELFFGNNNGFNSFFPDSIRKNYYKPSVAIVDIRISEVSIFSEKLPDYKSEFLTNNSITIEPGQNNIAFEFAALNYINAAKNQYKYKLDGYDKNWVNSGNFRYARYTNLDPGKYIFRIIASNNDGLWNEKETFCKLIIEPPFTKTWYFKVLTALFFGSIIVFINRIRIKNIENQKQREIAIHSAKMKEEFLANMSHEIRTPLNAISGMTNLMLKKPNAEEQNKYLNAIRQSSDNLNVIINDILDFSKIEAGKITFELTDFSVINVLENLKETLQYKAEEKGISFTVTHDSELPDYVIGDPVRLSQILINLAGNSIKFTNKGFVSVFSKPISGNDVRALFEHEEKASSINASLLCIYFEIKDSGIGISPDKIDKIFESFTQASSDTTRKFGGTGLGLTITKRLIDLQKGKLKVESGLNEGSKFSFVIPYQHSAKASDAPKQADDLSIIAAHLSGIKILLAEDNTFNQIVAVDTLKNEIKYITIDIADNGKIALEKIRENSYDMVLMDVQMPEMDGLEATRIIRSQFPDHKRNIPVLAMTAGALQSEIDKCIVAGMNDFITKPIVVEDLIRKISRHYSAKK